LTVVGVKTTDTGTMVAATGTLDFTQKITGTGSMSVDGGATLEVDSTVASTLSMTFNGGNGILALKDPSKFAATINGFAPGETIDLLAKKATSATLNGSDQLVIVNGSKAVATLQLAGTYTGDTFTVTSDGDKGSNITVTTGAALPPPAGAVVHPPMAGAVTNHQFIAAMAGMGAGGALSHGQPAAEPWRDVRLALGAPRPHLA
jgi:hypothetical protein